MAPGWGLALDGASSCATRSPVEYFIFLVATRKKSDILRPLQSPAVSETQIAGNGGMTLRLLRTRPNGWRRRSFWRPPKFNHALARCGILANKSSPLFRGDRPKAKLKPARSIYLLTSKRSRARFNKVTEPGADLVR
jgi:hypothetical protein